MHPVVSGVPAGHHQYVHNAVLERVQSILIFVECPYLRLAVVFGRKSLNHLVAESGIEYVVFDFEVSEVQSELQRESLHRVHFRFGDLPCREVNGQGNCNCTKYFRCNSQ